MGYSISMELANKLDRNRAEGRLCGGATTARHGCAIRATVRQTHEAWTHKIGEGEMRVSSMVVCGRHAKQCPVGYVGVNFRVIGEERF